MVVKMKQCIKIIDRHISLSDDEKGADIECLLGRSYCACTG